MLLLSAVLACDDGDECISVSPSGLLPAGGLQRLCESHLDCGRLQAESEDPTAVWGGTNGLGVWPCYVTCALVPAHLDGPQREGSGGSLPIRQHPHRFRELRPHPQTMGPTQ